MKRVLSILIGVILMCVSAAGSAGIGGAVNINVYAEADAARLITGVRVGDEELSAFQGADNMLMANAVDSTVSETGLTVHAAEGTKLLLDGEIIDRETARTVKLSDGFNSFTLTAEKDGKSETVFVNVERLPAGLYSESTRPVYHFTPYRHQMNDPNGLVYDASTGLYHLFFQCNRPFASGVDARTRTTGWGHAVSQNLITWEEQPMALTPDLLGAAWSGSGVVDRDNTSGLFDDSTPPESRLVVFYANVYGDETYGMAKISMAYSKDGGKTWIKYAGNPVVKNTANRYGAGLRDPKVIRYENPELEGGWCWLMVTCGNTYLFMSKDLINWKVQGGVVRDVNNKIVECECPDLFRLPVDGDPANEKWILTCGGVSYLIGDLVITDRGYIKFEAETEPVVNLNGIADQIPGQKAPEIYATQTFYTDPVGRRVSMSWIRDPYQNWRDKIWNSAQSIPLVNTLRTVGGSVKLCRYPVKEIDFARDKLLFSVSDTELGPEVENLLGSIHSDCFDLVAVITPGDAKNIGFALRYDGADAELKLRYSVDEKKLYVTKGGEAWPGVYEPEVHLDADGKLRLRLMMDKICYDVFGNDGETAIQGILYTQTGADGLMISADGDAKIDSLKVWSMAIPDDGIEVSRDPSAGTVTMVNDRDDIDGENGDNGSSNKDNKKSGLTAGKAALIALGSFAGTLALVGGGMLIARKSKNKKCG